MLFKLCDLFITRYLDAWKVDVITPDLRTQLNSHNPRILIEQRKHDLMRLRQQPARQLLFGVLDGLMIVCRLANGCGDSKATTDRVLRILLLAETSGVWTTNPDFQGWLRYIGGYKKKILEKCYIDVLDIHYHFTAVWDWNDSNTFGKRLNWQDMVTFKVRSESDIQCKLIMIWSDKLKIINTFPEELLKAFLMFSNLFD